MNSITFIAQGVHNPSAGEFAEHVNIVGEFDTIQQAIEAAQKTDNFDAINIFDHVGRTASWVVSRPHEFVQWDERHTWVISI